MKLKTSLLVSACLLVFAAGQVSAGGHASNDEDIVSQIQKGCATEIEEYCSQVTLGDGRLLACFYAHEDKISGQCQFALYDAAAQLERAVSALNYVAGQCIGDIELMCPDVQAGEGRIINCLESKGDALSAPCRQAIEDVFE